ncbi:Hsp20/alpha crystallin family protein [Rhodoplanes sp. TEM]|uniref:Hsp20/alpha crystallin family protein n=1 Tax=Rhodoplanes tepidamans TaxID=200616 RepID=A0ABT5J9G7_RHOTP|nr:MULTISPECIES: Hsp20/alpha crystallin family protein [Rhodoplanes]MDC7786051.1 Hsp20/alpha crystallin family protein [Rhodoplanes tepidamans]MDC7983808.1 Hsp20/alpha crystallin family protein [Rhodoplanes sp. TEM]MDQ0354894.1 HSP20 family protein [Rhodoplanes tepidamans]
MAEAEKVVATAATPPAETKPATRAMREWEPFETLRRQMDRLFEDVGRGFGLAPFGSSFFAMRPSLLADEAAARRPAVDLVETEKTYEITAELPGIAPEAVEVKLADGILTIKGEKKEEREETREGRHVAERRFGSFQRAFQLPDGIEEDAIAATFANGVLTVTLPKAAEPAKAAKTIAVTAKE